MDSRRWNLRPAKNGSRLLPVRGAKLLAPEFWLPTSAPCQGYSTLFRTTHRLPFNQMAHNFGPILSDGCRLLNSGIGPCQPYGDWAIACQYLAII